MKILITGATGFIGSQVTRQLVHEGNDIVILTRNEKTARERLPFPCIFFQWEPLQKIPPLEAFEGVDAVIHLAGEPIAERRWTAAEKEKIFQSRVLGTRLLIEGLSEYSKKSTAPQVFICSSAIGYY